MDSVAERLSVLTGEIIGLNIAPNEVIELGATIDSLGMDSLDVVEMTMAAEEEWGIEISDDEVDALRDFGQAVNLIERYIGNRTMVDNVVVGSDIVNRSPELPLYYEAVAVPEQVTEAAREILANMTQASEVAAEAVAVATEVTTKRKRKKKDEVAAAATAEVVATKPKRKKKAAAEAAAEIAAATELRIKTNPANGSAEAEVAAKPKRKKKKAAAEVVEVATSEVEVAEETSSRTLTFGSFTTAATEERPIFLIEIESIRHALERTDRFNGWRERLSTCRGEFEGHSCYSMARDQLDRFLSSVKRIVVGRWGSGTRHVEWVRIGSRTRLPPDVMQATPVPEFPEFQVENLAEQSNAFAVLAAAILGPVLRRKIMLVNTAQFSDRGGFQIYIARGEHYPNARLAIRHANRLFGYEDKNDYPHHVNIYSPDPENTTAVYIQDGMTTVAEVHPNGLLILAQVQDDFFGLRVFARILRESIRYFGSPEEYERIRAEVALAFRNSQREHIVASAERAIRYVEENNRGNRNGVNLRNVNHAEHVKQQIRDAERALHMLHAEMFAIQHSNNANTMQRITSEFDMLADGRFNLVNKVFFAPNGEFHMITDSIVAYDRQNRKYHLLGPCEMIVDFPGNTYSRYYPRYGGVRILQHVAAGQRRTALPHCGDEGAVCFGNIANEISALVSGFEIQALASLVITFLQRPNPFDRDGRRVRNFPECPAPTAPGSDPAPAIHAQHDEQRGYGQAL